MKKRFLLGIAIASVCAFSICSCNNGNNVTTSEVITTTKEKTTTTTTKAPDVKIDEKFYASESDSGELLLLSVNKKDNKLSDFYMFFGDLQYQFVPTYENNKIVGLTKKPLYGADLISYITVGNDFINNYENIILFKTNDKSLIVNMSGVELTIGFDGSSSVKNMTEIKMNSEKIISNSTIKYNSNSSVEIKNGETKTIYSRNDLGLSIKRIDLYSNEVTYETRIERDGNFENIFSYSNSSDNILRIRGVSRFTYDSNDRIIKADSYSIGEYGYFPEFSININYNELGLVSNVSGDYDYYYEYDSKGRVIVGYDGDEKTLYEYNDKGLYKTRIIVESNIENSKKYVYEYDINNIKTKETVYKYDTLSNDYTVLYCTSNYDYTNGYSEVTEYSNGKKNISSIIHGDNLEGYKYEQYDENSKLTYLNEYVNRYENGKFVERLNYSQSDGNRYLSSRIETIYQDDSMVQYHYNYDDANNIKSNSYKDVYSYENKVLKSLIRYSYNTLEKDYNIAKESKYYIYDGQKLIGYELLESGEKEEYEYEYKNDKITKISRLVYQKDDDEFVLKYISESIYENDNILEYNEYDIVNGLKQLSLSSKYNEFHDKVDEAYYYYNGEEYSDSSYKYEYSYDAVGNLISYKYITYNETTKKFDNVGYEKTVEYNGNNIIKITMTNYNENKITILENIYDSSSRIHEQIKIESTLDSVLSKTKHVYDYLNYSTLVYSYESDTWELKETLNRISFF